MIIGSGVYICVHSLGRLKSVDSEDEVRPLYNVFE